MVIFQEKVAKESSLIILVTVKLKKNMSNMEMQCTATETSIKFLRDLPKQSPIW